MDLRVVGSCANIQACPGLEDFRPDPPMCHNAVLLWTEGAANNVYVCLGKDGRWILQPASTIGKAELETDCHNAVGDACMCVGSSEDVLIFVRCSPLSCGFSPLLAC